MISGKMEVVDTDTGKATFRRWQQRADEVIDELDTEEIINNPGWENEDGQAAKQKEYPHAEIGRAHV